MFWGRALTSPSVVEQHIQLPTRPLRNLRLEGRNALGTGHFEREDFDALGF